jgi:acyl-CoA synthetase (NDP forming)
MSERRAYTRAELERLIAPRSVAIVGASPRAGSFGMRTLENLAHFRGEIHLVNPRYERIGERACSPALGALRAAPDCVVIVVPREGVEAALEEAAAAGAGAAIVYASGYGEMDRAEREGAQQRLAAIARAARMPMLGPNCMGLVNHALRAGMTFIPEYARMPPHVGPIAIVSQSGALGYSLAQAGERALGIRYFFSAGNSADVDVSDLIAALAEDPEVRAIACLFEGVPVAARLLEAGERARRAGKPVVVFKLGTSDAGAAAARSHTGSLAGSAVAWRALFERAGLVAVRDYEALVEYAKFFSVAGAPTARGVGVISGSGGAGVMAADKASEHGVPMPQPGEATSAVLRTVVPEFGAARNPCDPTGQVLSNPESFAQCCRAMLADPHYGAMVLPMTVATVEVSADRARLVPQLAREQPKPVALVWLSEWLQGPGSEAYESDPKVALFRSMDRCFAAIAAWHAFAERAGGAAAPGSRLAPPGAREAAAGIIAEAGDLLTERQAKRALAAYGVPVVEERLARSTDEAAAAARAIGFPVALKVESPAIAHKTEAGVVRLGIGDEKGVRAAFEEILANAGQAVPERQIHGVLVQPMASGIEVIVGGRVDPQVGPLVVVGSGGVLVELLRDVVTSLAPVSKEEARGMLSRLKGFGLLTGYRGSAPADLDAIADAVARISELIADFAHAVDEIDVNPLMCGPDRVVAVDALVTKSKAKP